MTLSKEELEHVLFLSQVVLEGNKKALMPSTLQSLMYIAKSLQKVDLSEAVADEIRAWIQETESELIHESERLSEIKNNLSHPYSRRPFGK